MHKIVIKKSDGKIVSFGTEDMSRFSPGEFDIVETTLEELPDELRFCKYNNGKVVVDEILKQQTLEKEARAEQEGQEAREHINLEDLARLSNEKIDNWVENNVTDLAGGRLAFKKLAKWCRALTRIARLRQDD